MTSHTTNSLTILVHNEIDQEYVGMLVDNECGEAGKSDVSGCAVDIRA